jgi:hypothetical protein
MSFAMASGELRTLGAFFDIPDYRALADDHTAQIGRMSQKNSAKQSMKSQIIEWTDEIVDLQTGTRGSAAGSPSGAF